MITRLLNLYSEGGIREVTRGVNDFTIIKMSNLIHPFLSGESVWEREWEILCILDGCRVDTFREVYGECETIRSVASTSPVWLDRTLKKQKTSDIGYISGNPHAANLTAEEFAFFHLENVTETEHGIETVPPDVLTDRAINAWRKRKELGINKLIVHYMQPHVPFRSRPEWFKNNKGELGWGSDIWGEIRYDIDKDELFEAYKDNLEWVLGDNGVERLLRNVNANVAISSDHGNAAGEWNFYGHSKGAPIKQVRNVPWVTVDAEDTNERNPTITETEEYNVEKSLEALGYK